MSTDNNVFRSLMDGLPKDDKISVLRSIDETRELQIDQKRHPRRRRRRNEDGVLEPLSGQVSETEEIDPEHADEADESELWEMSD